MPSHHEPRHRAASRPLTVAAALIASLAAPLLQAQSTPPPALTVTAAKAAFQDWPEEIRAPGAIAAWQEAVVSAQVGGARLVEVLAEVGEHVNA
ncbi:MAG: efflux transporter periplasmic adaptor subunit, partial [Polyangiaceae bacterium]